MSNRLRFLALFLALSLFVALALLPVPPTRADDSVWISSPVSGASVVGAIEVRGRAMTADPSQFSFYRMHYGSGSSPSSLRPIGSAGEYAVDDGLLGTWDTSPLFAGEYTLQLTVYDTSGGTATASVVVNVLPAPTPTPRNQPSVLIPVVGETPTATEGEAEPEPTPLPELPALVPNIPNIYVPEQNNPPPPIQPVEPLTSDPGFQPIQIDPGGQPSLPQQPIPNAPAPGSLPTMDASQPIAPTPTQFGLPP
jgi:hypothetical protein